MIYIFVFIFGAIIGSFLNVIIIRYNTGESVVFAGSRCFSCGKKLSWPELIPIFSFLFQKGRCRKCKSKISWQYPIVEALTGLIFLAVFWKSDFRLEVGLPYYLLIFSLLIAISVYDIRHQIIPNGLVYFLIFLSFLLAFFENWKPAYGAAGWEIGIWDLGIRILTGLAFFSFFSLLWLVSRGRWMGLGDAKLALAMGWLLSPGLAALGLLLAVWAGAIFSIFLLLFSPKNFTLKSRIPFGPFLCLGTIIAFLMGNNILQTYFYIFSRII